ncbi:MAG: hypothetical protein M3Q60_06330 [Actinomycetota bacterium]|nr:hypothetical protein [Actinomycetota bacterium]
MPETFEAGSDMPEATSAAASSPGSATGCSTIHRSRASASSAALTGLAT